MFLTDLKLFFIATCAENSSCVIVKPHCVLNSQFGSVLAKIQASGWDVKAVKLHNFERANAEEFYEVYKEVVQEYDIQGKPHRCVCVLESYFWPF